MFGLDFTAVSLRLLTEVADQNIGSGNALLEIVFEVFETTRP